MLTVVKGRRRLPNRDRAVHDDDRRIRELHAEGKTTRQIAQEVGLGLTIVYKAHERLGLERNTTRPCRRSAAKPESLTRADERPSPVQVAFQHLHYACLMAGRPPRLVERDGGYWLDRRPTNLDLMIRELNRELVRRGRADHRQAGVAGGVSPYQPAGTTCRDCFCRRDV